MHAKSRYSLFGCFRRNRAGAAAVEFAIGAPLLLGGLVVMADLGLAINAKMNLEQAVRAGAEFVMGGATDADQIEEMVASAATGYSSDDPNNVDNKALPTVTALKVCKCPGSDAPVSCSDLCAANQKPPYAYYDIDAQMTYDALFLPDMTLATTIEVQVR